MTALIDDVRARAIASSPGRYFYFYMALPCMAVAFLGFAPTYWLPLASGSFSSTPVVHFHGLLFFTWTLYFAFQTWLAASGRTARHRTMGMIGVSLATAMTIFGFLVAVNAMKRSAAIGQLDAGIAFAIVPLSGILFFAVVFGLAVANTGRPETHKRLMLLAGISWMRRWRAGFSPSWRRPDRLARLPSRSPSHLRWPPISARGRDRRGLAHARTSAPRLYLRRRGPGGDKTAELADQHDAGLAFPGGGNISAGAVARGSMPSLRKQGPIRRGFSVQERCSTTFAQPRTLVVMGPCFRRDDERCFNN
jgi:hypothetical protein